MSSSLHDMHTDLPTYVSQVKYYERMQKVKERQQHVQEASTCQCLVACTDVAGLGTST